MKTRRAKIAAALLVAASVALGGCGSTASPGAGPSTSVTSPAGAVPTGPHNDADVAFATDMVPHHQQAVQMSVVLLAKSGVSADVLGLATQIKAAQAPEITEMTGWLAGWGAPSPSAMGGMGGMGPGNGMMSQADMDALESADGAQAQRLYLTGMIGHHRGAVAMAQTELAQGQNASAQALATSIISTQNAEITTMQKLLAGQ